METQHELIIEYPLENLVKITCPEGCLITNWQEGDSISTYNSSNIVYCNRSVDIAGYHCISIEKDAEIQAQKEELEKEKLVNIATTSNIVED